jgi:hypothetical protein
LYDTWSESRLPADGHVVATATPAPASPSAAPPPAWRSAVASLACVATTRRRQMDAAASGMVCETPKSSAVRSSSCDDGQTVMLSRYEARFWCDTSLLRDAEEQVVELRRQVVCSLS